MSDTLLTIGEIAAVIAEKNGLSTEAATTFVEALFDTIREGVESDGMVKVRGLGTFRVISVEARESINVNTGERLTIESHSKLTFTPDSTMREIVNRPFSQFETVAVNGDITFDNASTGEKPEQAADDDDKQGDTPTTGIVEEHRPTDASEETIGSKEAASDDNNGAVTIGSKETASDDNNGAVTIGSKEAASDDNNGAAAIGSKETASDDNNGAAAIGSKEAASDDNNGAAAIVAKEKVTDDNDEEEEADNDKGGDDDEEEEEEADDGKGVRIMARILWALVVVLLMGGAAYGGYLYGRYEVESEIERSKWEAITDSQRIASRERLLAAPADTDTTHIPLDATKIGAMKPKPKSDGDNTAKTGTTTGTNAATTAKKDDEAVDYKKYEAMDIRVKTGAYRIVGTDKVVTVKKGQTLSQISKTYLGPGMECYVEVYNGVKATDELKEGTKIKIPKLKWKK